MQSEAPSPTADSVVASSIPAGSHTFVEIDHEIISTVILLLLLIQEGLWYVQEVLVIPLVKLGQEIVWLGELTASRASKLLTWTENLKPLTAKKK